MQRRQRSELRAKTQLNQKSTKRKPNVLSSKSNYDSKQKNIRVVKEYLTGEDIDDSHWMVLKLFRQGMYVNQVTDGKGRTGFHMEMKWEQKLIDRLEKRRNINWRILETAWKSDIQYYCNYLYKCHLPVWSLIKLKRYRNLEPNRIWSSLTGFSVKLFRFLDYAYLQNKPSEYWIIDWMVG